MKGQCVFFHSTVFLVCLCGWSWSSGTFFPQKCPSQWEESLQGTKCLSASSTNFIHLYLRTPTLSCSNLLTAFLLTSFIKTFPTFIIILPKSYLQLKQFVHGTNQRFAISAQKSHNPHCAEILFSSFWEIIIC